MNTFMNTFTHTPPRCLSYPRQHGWEGEARYIVDIIARIEEDEYVTKYIDEQGNIFVKVCTGSCKAPTTLFTAHTDTVHGSYDTLRYMLNEQEFERDSAPEIYKRALVGVDGKIHVVSRAGGGILGADDGLGCEMLIHMISKRVAGWYAFYRGEEAGCVGSEGSTATDSFAMRHVYYPIKRAIAFDRAGVCDVVNVQRGEACCSDEFANALSSVLDFLIPTMWSPTRGSYTDTASLTYIIPECTNLSIGYYAQHTHEEWYDAVFFELLKEAVVTIDWENLPTSRSIPTNADDEWNGAEYWEDWK